MSDFINLTCNSKRTRNYTESRHRCMARKQCSAQSCIIHLLQHKISNTKRNCRHIISFGRRNKLDVVTLRNDHLSNTCYYSSSFYLNPSGDNRTPYQRAACITNSRLERERERERETQTHKLCTCTLALRPGGRGK